MIVDKATYFWQAHMIKITSLPFLVNSVICPTGFKGSSYFSFAFTFFPSHLDHFSWTTLSFPITVLSCP